MGCRFSIRARLALPPASPADKSSPGGPTTANQGCPTGAAHPRQPRATGVGVCPANLKPVALQPLAHHSKTAQTRKSRRRRMQMGSQATRMFQRISNSEIPIMSRRLSRPELRLCFHLCTRALRMCVYLCLQRPGTLRKRFFAAVWRQTAHASVPGRTGIKETHVGILSF